MSSDKQNEELLREASAFGDEEGVRKLLDSGVDINGQHSVNGWTALHWAAKRGHTRLVHFLLSKNADTSLTSVYGETALSLASNDEICKVLSGDANYKSSEIKEKCVLPITPNYFSNPVLTPKIVKNGATFSEDRRSNSVGENDSKRKLEEEMILKVRIADSMDQDFIEVEVPQSEMTYENVFQVCCDELNVNAQNVLKLRKLPNTIVRKDKDVSRFQNFQELELVLKDSNNPDQYMESDEDPSFEEVNIQVWLKKPNVIGTFVCEEIGDMETRYPGHLIVTDRHLYILRTNRLKKGYAHIVATRPLSSIVKVTSKEECPEWITFAYEIPTNAKKEDITNEDFDASYEDTNDSEDSLDFLNSPKDEDSKSKVKKTSKALKGHSEEDGAVVTARDHLFIPKAEEATSLIKYRIFVMENHLPES